VRSRLNAQLVVISNPTALQLSKFLSSVLKLPTRHDRISQSFIDHHNRYVEQLFGTYVTPDDAGGQEDPAVTKFVPGRLFELLATHREWGRDVEFFCACALKTVTALSVEHPYLTEEMFVRSVQSMVSGILTMDSHRTGYVHREYNMVRIHPASAILCSV